MGNLDVHRPKTLEKEKIKELLKNTIHVCYVIIYQRREKQAQQ